MKLRGFEIVSKYISADGNPTIDNFIYPHRATDGSAGYDIFNNTGDDISLSPGESIIIQTCLKSYMLPDEVLTLYPRSGHGFKYLVRLANTCGIIDSDYYNCEANEGEIHVKLTNPERSNAVLTIPNGNAICQGIFTKVLFTDDDFVTVGGTRKSGIGSTDNK